MTDFSNIAKVTGDLGTGQVGAQCLGLIKNDFPSLAAADIGANYAAFLQDSSIDNLESLALSIASLDPRVALAEVAYDLAR